MLHDSKSISMVLAILAVPLAILGVFMSTSSAARAEKAFEDASNNAFKIFDSESSRGSRGGIARGDDDDQPVRSRRRASANRDADDDQPVRSRRRAAASSRSSDDDEPAPARRRSKGRQVASLGGGAEFSAPRPGRSIGGGGNVTWVANSGCLNGTLRGVVASVAASYGSVTVNSTCRSAGHNAAVGGAPKSYHLSGNAVDFRVHGNISGAASYLAGLGGGYKHYGGGLFHVDTGPRRPF